MPTRQNANGPAQGRPVQAREWSLQLLQDDLDAAVTLFANLRSGLNGWLGEATAGKRNLRPRDAMLAQPVADRFGTTQGQTHVVFSSTNGVGVAGQRKAAVVSLSGFQGLPKHGLRIRTDVGAVKLEVDGTGLRSRRSRGRNRSLRLYRAGVGRPLQNRRTVRRVNHVRRRDVRDRVAQ